jgi:hypothetical protein
MQSKEYGEKLLKRTPYGVRVEGVDVVMTVGSKAVRMEYSVALKLGVFLYHAGKRAKKLSGDECLAGSSCWRISPMRMPTSSRRR